MNLGHGAKSIRHTPPPAKRDMLHIEAAGKDTLVVL